MELRAGNIVAADHRGHGAAIVGLRHQIVITFLAILEMTKLKLIRLQQPSPQGEIYISRNQAGGTVPIEGAGEEYAG